MELRELAFSYGDHPVLDGLTFSVASGELFALVGESGSGKSTALSLIAGLQLAHEGSIWIHGKDMTRQPPERRGIGVVFQSYALFPT